ncbi:ABC transporter ATP-binding protein [Bremerella sp. JC817]|uniref:ABC transporter ATP-binding protein n=1 Tax=Bremerella sp. JC817 TaxID=3231756 RepID=UPI0034599709
MSNTMSDSYLTTTPVPAVTPQAKRPAPHINTDRFDTPIEVDRPILKTTGLYKSYRKGQHIIPVLRGVDFVANEGRITSIIGQSGSGKSTLLHLLGTLDVPDRGEIYFDEQRTDNLPTRQRDRLRNGQFGLIFQFYHLLPELTMLENVLTPAMISHGLFKYWANRKQLKDRARQLLELVGLGHRLNHKPRELSGGEMQRTAIARALISNPKVLLADEPTGNLDRQTGREVLNILRKLNEEQGLTIVMVTHDQSIADEADSIVRLVEGCVEHV